LRQSEERPERQEQDAGHPMFECCRIEFHNNGDPPQPRRKQSQ
jgi:hypothetical protein